MSKNYTQLSLGQRYQIEALIKTGFKQKEIAKCIGIHPSTICRELGRNIAKRGRGSGVYAASNAQRKTDMRHQQKAKRIVFTQVLKDEVVERMSREKWSPELIYEQAKLVGRTMVSHESIYHWIWQCKHRHLKKNIGYKKLYQLLRHGKRRRKRGNRKDSRGIIPNRISIEKRPGVVKQRKRLGDLEIDLMMGKAHKSAVLVMTDRATLHTCLRKLESKESKEVSNAIVKCLKTNRHKVHTLTFDNDKAFAGHEQIAKKASASSYFTRPYTSQDKGTVENRIGVIRRFIPKGTDLRKITDDRIKEIENMLNERPIRKFNYLTANQVLQKKIALIT